MSVSGRLFSKQSLDDELIGRRKDFFAELEKIPQSQFDANSDEQLRDFICSRAWLDPITLNENGASLDFEAVSVDISRDPNRRFFERPTGPIHRPGRRAILSIPFVGESWLFEYVTNPRLQYAEINGEVTAPRFDGDESVIQLHVLAANDVPEEHLLRQLEEQRKILRATVQYSSNQVKDFNQYMKTQLPAAITARRLRTAQHVAIAAQLNIPIRKRADAPSIEPVRLAPRRVPSLNPARQEFGITEENYDHILQLIRHQGKTYEATPDTYAKHTEEELRDIVLGQLNGHFLGDASGETFRCRGKTDIRIEAEDRSAFVAECKLWSGKASIRKALNQLLSYMMWRDSKAALIVFKTSATRMSSVVEKLPEAIAETGLATTSVTEVGKGEWVVSVRSAVDKNQIISLRTLVFDITPRKTA